MTRELPSVNSTPTPSKLWADSTARMGINSSTDDIEKLLQNTLQTMAKNDLQTKDPQTQNKLQKRVKAPSFFSRIFSTLGHICNLFKSIFSKKANPKTTLSVTTNPSDPVVHKTQKVITKLSPKTLPGNLDQLKNSLTIAQYSFQSNRTLCADAFGPILCTQLKSLNPQERSNLTTWILSSTKFETKFKDFCLELVKES